MITKKELITVTNEKIISVEPGNVNKVPVEKTVIAFSVLGTGHSIPIKALLKGEKAFNIYNAFLANGQTMDSPADSEIKSSATVSFSAFVKEKRDKEVVVSDCSNFEFNFSYKVVN